tara:strand:+ start:119 stop:841 length:723 start_codon:yes stop_codon:yes gene_type:complete
MLSLIQTWLDGGKKVLSNPGQLNEVIRSDFAGVKKQARESAKTEFQRLATLNEMSPEHPAPKGSQSDAEKNGSKGARQRRRPLENLQELVETDLEAALASVKECGPNEPQLSWSERTSIWAAPKAKRCMESTNQIVVGTDSAGLVHVLGEQYRDSYHVQTRKVGGQEQEYCTVSVGPNGATEEVEVIIGSVASGTVFEQMQRVITESRNLLRNASKFVRDCMDAETYERHEIPNVAKQDD